MRRSKGQSAMELLIIVGGVFLFFMAILGVFYGKIADKNDEKRQFEIQELALELENELNIAAEAADGYSRSFYLPGRLAGLTYSVTLLDGFLYINTTDNRDTLGIQVQNASGQFVLGADNRITKIDGIIYVNP